ncbi:glycerophosphoryl diester phosphodiesterase [Melghirimyces profundicolus]|uniref:Glycerophosphoryl diester phosphodiesterase n=1 Tax=Melghirimyces profundicolus TaxID=1242148 RepID=A0A2T6C9V7_9BACL|nr:glycerophosphodiester phosphodiesterase [Melghirimyces profundicolus]PTX65063.1 glycerophosphoryl diester phosphodiesterase [Melghirimyces profundicolus]
MNDVKVYAHRGYSSVAPENTMAAFRRAAEAGADGLELDVHLTKDGHVVVIHDYTLQRTTDGTGRVKDFTLEEIRRLDAGSWFGEEFRCERVPLLEEVLGLAADRDLYLNIELKNNQYPEPGLENRVLELTERYGWTGKTVISSFNHHSLRKVKREKPDLDTAILYMSHLFEPWEYVQRAGLSSIHPYWPTVTKEMAESCRERGLPLRPFTVNRAGEMRRLVSIGVEAIITDKVETLLEVLRDDR